MRNHGGYQEWTLLALLEYTYNRIFVLMSRVPPADGTIGAPSEDELNQVGRDLLYVQDPRSYIQVAARTRAGAAVT